MNKTEQALQTFNEKFSCSQAVFSAFADDFGVDRETALRVAQAFGGGIARTGETCGAATGALMALGLRYGMVTAGDEKAKDRTYAEARDFLARFKAANQQTTCRGLLGVEIGTPEGQKAFKEQNMHATVCSGLVASAVQILEEMLEEARSGD